MLQSAQLLTLVEMGRHRPDEVGKLQSKIANVVLGPCLSARLSACLMKKSTVDQIRQRFDKDVARFSNLETGQSATIDAPLVLDLIAKAAKAVRPDATHLLDIGCGAGNYTLKLLELLPLSEITLIDLSQPMLERAKERISAVTASRLNLHQVDIREFRCGEQEYDVVVAAAVL